MTSKDYEKAIKAKYLQEKTGFYAEYLAAPSPSLLKRLALLRYDGADKRDKETYRRFFDLNNDSNPERQIENFDGDKLKPLCNYLKGETKSTRITNIEFLAILVDFEPRPLSSFNKSVVAPEPDTEIIHDNVPDASTNMPHNYLPKQKADYNIIKRKTYPVYIFFILLIFCAGYVIVDVVNKKCMIWKENHYEAVDCDEYTNSFHTSAKVVPLDKETFKYQKKIKVTDTTQFFRKDGTPCVWYTKTNGEIQFFTYPGLHPETGKTLKPISHYMINKYIEN